MYTDDILSLSLQPFFVQPPTIIIITMSVLDPMSCECLKSELDLFSVPPTQTSIEQTAFKQYHPISSLSGHSPIEFHVPATDEDYLDLQQSYLYLKVRILSGVGEILTAGDNVEAPVDGSFVFPINYFVSTQFKSVDVYLSNSQVSPNDNLYAYRSYLETLLSYGSDVKDGPLQCGLYFPDTDEPDLHSKDVNKGNCANSGARIRYLNSRYSSPLEMMGRIHNPLFHQQKLLLNKVDLRLKFNRHDPRFCLMAFKENENYSIAIDQAILNVCHKTVSPSVRESHEIGLMKSNAKYPIRQSEMKFFTKAAGHADLSEPNLCSGVIPRRIIVGLVRSAAFNGSTHHNPLNFETHGLESIQVRRNGVALPFDELKMDFANRHGVNGYMSLYQSFGRLFRDRAISLTLDDYISSGCSLYAFDLSQDGEEHNLSPLQEGTVSLQIKLQRATDYSVTIVVYMEKDGLVEIDKDRNVTIEA